MIQKINLYIQNEKNLQQIYAIINISHLRVIKTISIY